METYLEHHGILGQKWGVRRYQNADGTLTDKGRKKYQKSYDRYIQKANININKRYDKNLSKIEKDEDKLRRLPIRSEKDIDMRIAISKGYEGRKKANEILRSMEHKKINDLSLDDYGDARLWISSRSKSTAIGQFLFGIPGNVVASTAYTTNKDYQQAVSKIDYKIKRKDQKEIENDEIEKSVIGDRSETSTKNITSNTSPTILVDYSPEIREKYSKKIPKDKMKIK